MKLTPARFIACYNALGIRFDLQAGIVTTVGASPVFAAWVRAHSAWLKPWLGTQSVVRVQVEQPSVRAESTHADRLVWDGMQNARRHEAKVKAIKEHYR
jgi:hypothetical protein